MSSLKENKMGTMPIGRLLLTMALPMALSMLVQALYNVVDSAFVAKISDVNQDALNAVSLAFPVQNIMIGIATGTAVGVNALLSRALGERNADMVNRSALNGVFLAGLGMLLSALFGIFCAELFMRSQTSNEAVIAYGTAYIRIITIASFGIFGEIIFERLLQSTGRTIYTLVTQGTGAVLNIIFDPILIFGLFGLPRMEVAGAAVATVLGQIVAFILAMILNHRKNPDVRLHLRGFRPDWRLIGRILAIGVPSMIMVAIGSVMYYGMNLVLMRFEHVRVGLGEVGTAVFGAYYKLQSFIFMPCFGLNNAMVPIVSYNYGAQKFDRVRKTVRLTVFTAIGIMCVGCALFELIPETLLGMFSPTDEMLSIGRVALRIIGVHFPLAGFSIIAGSACQALGKPIYALINSVCRQIVVLLPAAYLLSLTGRLELVWLAFPIAEVVSVILNATFLRLTYRVSLERK